MSKADDKFLEAKAPHTRGFDVRPGSLDREAGTVEVIASTGARVRRSGWLDEYEEELVISDTTVDLTRFVTVGPVLDNHSAWGSVLNVLGIVERAWIEDGKLMAKLRFDMADPVAAEVFGKIERGILRAVSLGYDAAYERIRAKDRDDGGDVDLYRSTRLEPYEVSVVTMPADAAATFRSAPESRKKYPITTRTREPEESTMSERQTETQPSTAPTQAPDSRETLKAGLQRVATVRQQLRALALPEDQAEALVIAHDDDLKLRSAMLTLVEERQRATGAQTIAPTVKVEMGRTSEEKHGDLLGGALLSRALQVSTRAKLEAHNARAAREGLEVIKAPTDPEMIRAARKPLLMLCEDFLVSRGINTSRMSPNDIASAAISYRSGVGGLHTTTDFSGLLANTANKILQVGYAEVTSPWRELIGRRNDRPDFKQFSIYRRSAAPNLEIVNEHGEVKTAKYLESGPLTGQLKTAGIQVGMTRQMIVNDDLDAFAEQTLGLGDSAMRFEDDTVIVDLLLGNPTLGDSVAFFATGRGNLATDVGTPDLNALVHVAGLFAKMTETVGKAGNNAGTTTRKISQDVGGFLAGFAEAVAINQLLRPEGYVPTAGTSAIPDFMRGLNAYRDARLQVEATAPDVWFGFSAQRRAIAYGFLAGETGPRLSQMEAAGTDGVVFKLIHDFYAAVADPTAMVRVPIS